MLDQQVREGDTPLPMAAPQAGRLRVLVVAAQPGAGDAPDAVFRCFAALRARPGIDAFLLTSTPRDRAAPLGTALHQPWDDAAAFALDAGDCDPFGHRGGHPGLPRAFAALLRRLAPDIVDFRGFPWFGVDAFAQVRRVLPDARVVLTLDRAAASEAGMLDGAGAAPEAFLREMFIRRFLAEVDCLVAHGPMLGEALAAWGVPCRRVAVIAPGPAEPPRPVPPPPVSHRLVAGCFADSLDDEGIAVLREAADALRSRPQGTRPTRIELHGDTAPIRSMVQAHAAAGPSSLVCCAALPGRDAAAAIGGWHAMLVPGHSRSDMPDAARTALALGRPVLCGDKGGTAAVVRDGQDGFHFRACSGVALADLIDDLAAVPERLGALQPRGTMPSGLQVGLEARLALFRSLAARHG